MEMEELTKVFKGLSDETRLKILALLWDKPLCVCEIMGTLGITQTKASRHLIYLKNAGLLTSKREDKWTEYRVREDLPDSIKEILERTINIIKESRDFQEICKKLKEILSDSTYRLKFGIE